MNELYVTSFVQDKHLKVDEAQKIWFILDLIGHGRRGISVIG